MNSILLVSKFDKQTLKKVAKYPLGESLSFWRATNYDNDFYSLGDKFVKDNIETNIESTKEAWPCEHQKAVADETDLDSTAVLYPGQDGSIRQVEKLTNLVFCFTFFSKLSRH